MDSKIKKRRIFIEGSNDEMSFRDRSDAKDVTWFKENVMYKREKENTNIFDALSHETSRSWRDVLHFL